MLGLVQKLQRSPIQHSFCLFTLQTPIIFYATVYATVNLQKR